MVGNTQPIWTDDYVRALQGETGLFFAYQDASDTGQAQTQRHVGIVIAASDGQLSTIPIMRRGQNSAVSGMNTNAQQNQRGAMGYTGGTGDAPAGGTPNNQQWCITRLSEETVNLVGANSETGRARSASP